MEGLEQLAATFVDLLTTYGYFILVPLLVIEGPLVGIVAGLLASLGVFNPYIVFVVHMIGDFITDAIMFYTPRHALGFAKRFEPARKVIERYETGDHNGRESIKDLLHEHFGKIFMFTKTFPMPHLFMGTLIAASLSGISSKRFLKMFILFQPLWSALLVSFGYYFGSSIQNTRLLFNGIGVFLLVLAIMLVIYYTFGERLVRKSFIGRFIEGINSGNEKERK